MELEQISELVGNDTDKANKLLELFRKENDKNISRALNTYTEKTLPNLVESEVKKRTEIDPIQKKQAELDLKLKAIQVANETSIPFDIVLKQLSGDDNEDAKSISQLAEYVANVRIQKAKEMLRGSAHRPQSGDNTPTFDAESIKRVPFKERIRLYKNGSFNSLLGRNK